MELNFGRKSYIKNKLQSYPSSIWLSEVRALFRFKRTQFGRLALSRGAFLNTDTEETAELMY